MSRAPSRRQSPRRPRLCLERLETRVLPSFFNPPLAYDVGPEPRSVAVGDLTGNGILDLVTADANIAGHHVAGPTGLSVLLGNGDGSFQPAARTIPAGDNPIAVVVGDFNGDGIPDLAVADIALIRGTSAVRVFLGNGDGTFQAPLIFDAGAHPRALAVGDFNGDGILDLAVADDGTFPDYQDSGMTVLMGRGDGSFRASVFYHSGPEVTSVAVADLTGNGIPDLVATNIRGNTISVLMGNGDGTFADARSFPAGTNPISVAVGDFQGNGIPDLAVTGDNSPGTLSVLLGRGDGTFQAPNTYAAGDHPTALVVGDFSHNGVLDLAYVHDSSFGNLDVLLGNGDGTFRAGGSFVSGSGSTGVAVGNFYGDGQLDLAVANNADDTVSVLHGNGDGTFQTADSLIAGRGPRTEVAADLLGNGIPDLVVENDFQGTGNVSVFLGNGDGTFQAPRRNYDVGGLPNNLAVGDLRGNGILDIVVGLNNVNQSLSVLLGNGDGTFQAPQRYVAGRDSAAVAIADFNGDGIPDIATADIVDNTVSLLFGNGDGTFQPPQHIAAGTEPRGLTVADFNGDGIPDLAVADEGDLVSGNGSGVSILLGNGDGTFQPRLSFSAGRNPVSVAVGDLTGNGLLDLAVADYAVFNGTPGVSVLLGHGDGTFGAARLFAAGDLPTDVAIGDFNNDGAPSLAVAGQGGTRILRGNGDGTFQTTYLSYVTGWSTAVVSGAFHSDGLPDLAVASGSFGRVFLLTNDGTSRPAGGGTRTQPTNVPEPPSPGHLASPLNFSTDRGRTVGGATPEQTLAFLLSPSGNLTRSQAGADVSNVQDQSVLLKSTPAGDIPATGSLEAGFRPALPLASEVPNSDGAPDLLEPNLRILDRTWLALGLLDEAHPEAVLGSSS